MHIHICGIFNPNLIKGTHTSFNVFKGNIKEFSVKIFVTGDKIFPEHLTNLKVCCAIIKTYICSKD